MHPPRRTHSDPMGSRNASDNTRTHAQWPRARPRHCGGLAPLVVRGSIIEKKKKKNSPPYYLLPDRGTTSDGMGSRNSVFVGSHSVESNQPTQKKNFRTFYYRRYTENRVPMRGPRHELRFFFPFAHFLCSFPRARCCSPRFSEPKAENRVPMRRVREER